MLIFLLVLLLLVGGYVLSTVGRRKHPGLEKLRGWAYAHRGLHDAARPENSLSAFRAAVSAGYGIELDVHLLRDGTLAVMHDSLLKRTTGAEGRIEDLTADRLSDFYLEGSLDTIPTFRQVLELVDGQVPLIVELKAVDNNHAALTQATCELLSGYRGVYCMESFDPRCVHWLRKHRPEILRGQLSENSLRSKVNVPWVLRFALTYQLLNFLTMPDFVAYKYADRRNIGNFLVRRLWGIPGASWTLKSRREYATATAEGWLPIFEGFTP